MSWEVSVVLSHPACAVLLQHPWEIKCNGLWPQMTPVQAEPWEKGKGKKEKAAGLLAGMLPPTLRPATGV